MTDKKIWLIVFLVILAVIIISMMSLLILKVPFTFNSEKKVILHKQFEEKEISNLVIDGISSDVSVVLHDKDYFEVEIYGNEKDDAKAEVQGSDLKISQDGNTLCFGFCFGEKKIIVRVPNNATVDADVKTVSGDVTINPYMNNIKVETTSGDIDVIEAGDVDLLSVSGDIKLTKSDKAILKTTSGDIKVSEVTSILDMKTTSGDIDVYKANLILDSKIQSTSGDVYVKMLNNVYVETKTTSGDVYVANNDRHAKAMLKITTISGDIKVNN